MKTYFYWCNECDWQEHTDEHQHDFCPNCGHVNISRRKNERYNFITLYTSHKGKELFRQGKAFEACTETIRAYMLEIKVSEKHIQHKQGNMRVISIGSDTSFV